MTRAGYAERRLRKFNTNKIYWILEEHGKGMNKLLNELR